jgi:Ca2+/Na+ antiporter
MTQFQQVTTFLERAVQSSGLATLGAHIAQWTRNSFLYRWLTTEPDPEIIVIDLRETDTVGPLLALLDRLVTPLTSAWQTARTHSLTQATHETLQNHPIRTVSLVALAALLTELAVSLTTSTLTSTGIGARLLVLTLAALGTQIHVSWGQCTESATYRYLVAALEPPEPATAAEAEDDRNDQT